MPEDLLEKIKKLKEQTNHSITTQQENKKNIVEIKTQLSNPSITIRKLMAVREMFNLKSPNRVNKKSLAKLIIRALKTIE